MHVSEFDYLVEDCVSKAVAGHFPLDWKEDPITHALMIDLRSRFRYTTLEGMRQPLRIEWEIYKLHGPRESAHGDIGLLVRYSVPGAGVIEGAGFLEAKLRGRDTVRFLQIRHNQVTRILARSPQTRLVLYDYNPVAVLEESQASFADWDSPFPGHIRRFPGRTTVSHAPVLPLQLAATLNQYDDTLYRFCHSFSYQLRQRYFQLHDLDFTETAVRAVKGFSSDLGSPNFILVVRAAPQGQEMPEEFRPNDNLYGGLEGA